MTIPVSSTDPTPSEQQARLCRHNIAACQAYAAGFVKLPPLTYAPPQRNYKPQPLKAPLPVRVTAVKSYPTESLEGARRRLQSSSTARGQRRQLARWSQEFRGVYLRG
jgi:hypothetical protein